MSVRSFLVFGLCLLISLPGLAGAKARVARTAVENFKPQVMPKKQHDGFCWAYSISVMRNDSWRCESRNEIFDPCFTTTSPKTLICGVGPGNSRDGFLLKLTKPLPDVAWIKPEARHIWIAELDDGQLCQIYAGAMPVVRTKDTVMGVAYGCGSGGDRSSVKSGLLADSIVTGKIWKAKKITYAPDGKYQKIINIQEVDIKRVWQ